MSRCLGQPVRVTRAAGGEPAAFAWRGAQYHVAEVLARWHLVDRWWLASPQTAPAGTPDAPAATTAAHRGLRDASVRAASDREYYRVRCADHQVFDLYYDAAADVWVLDRAHD